ncbi:MAG: hypothetical protein WCO42_07660 [bacterium]
MHHHRRTGHRQEHHQTRPHFPDPKRMIIPAIAKTLRTYNNTLHVWLLAASMV